MVSPEFLPASNLATGVFNRMLLNYESVRDQISFIREARGDDLKKIGCFNGRWTVQYHLNAHPADHSSGDGPYLQYTTHGLDGGCI
jgi:hypothetical protein